MSVVNGQLANQTTFNNAFVSRTAATTSTVAKFSLNNGGSTAIDDTQKFQGQLAETLGIAENDATRLQYSSNFYITNGDSHKEAIGELDTQLKSTQDEVDDHETRISTLEADNSTDVTLAPFGSAPNSNGATLTGQQITLQPADGSNPGGVSTGTQSFGGNKTFNGNVIVQGDFTVNGTQTIINSTDLQVADQNILINKGGNDASAEEGGIDVKRTTTNAAIRFDSTLASFFKIGLVGALKEIIVSGIAQTIAGIKTFSSAPIFSSLSASTALRLDGSKQLVSSIENVGQQAITSGLDTVSVVFTTPFASTNYSVAIAFRNTNVTDLANGLIWFSYQMTAKSTTGFTLNLNFPANTGNYFVDYIAKENL